MPHSVVAEEQWQITLPTIKERKTFMFNNNLFSDVKFIVRRAHDEIESKKVIPAHKFVLSISSPVFSAMFYGKLAETKDSIEMSECGYESLLELFRYIYSDEVNLSGSTVMEILYLSKKYMLPSLTEKCTQYLQDNLDASNVFSVLPSAQIYEEMDLVYDCWKMIDKRTDEAVKSDGFEAIDRSLLETVVQRDTLNIEEVELFKAVDLWATRACEKQGLAADGEVKRRILGEQIVKSMRIPTMKLEDFASVVLDSKILTTDEIVNIVKYLGSVSSSPVGFPETIRAGFDDEIQRCCRFGSMSWSYGYFGSVDSMRVSVDKDVLLHGLCFFGSENNTYSIDLHVKNMRHRSALVSKSGQFSSESLQCQIGNYCGFKVLFDTTVVLEKNTIYCIEAKISGPNSLRGDDGVSSVVCPSGVTFTFMDSESFGSTTSVTYGQFSEFLFSLNPL
ncbi:BTB/POZ domain-containing protein 6-like [Oculina patagonica]